MVTKGVIEKIIDDNHLRVRLPIYDKPKNVINATNTDDLGIATICTMPNCYINYNIGDIVYVAFEDNEHQNLVILGSLSNKNKPSNTKPTISSQDLTVLSSAQLPLTLL